MRAGGPVWRDEKNALWGVVHHAPVIEVEGRADVFSSRGCYRSRVVPQEEDMIAKDDPVHREQRARSRAGSPRRRCSGSKPRSTPPSRTSSTGSSTATVRGRGRARRAVAGAPRADAPRVRRGPRPVAAVVVGAAHGRPPRAEDGGGDADGDGSGHRCGCAISCSSRGRAHVPTSTQVLVAAGPSAMIAGRGCRRRLHRRPSSGR